MQPGPILPTPPPAPGPLGWIAPRFRTNEQNDAHYRAIAVMPRFALAPQDVPKGTKIMLTDFWKDPEVVADIGFEFNGFFQYTGSCVGVSDGNAVATVSFIQRKLADNPTKAFVPFWPFSYGRTRYLEGDRGQGEGAVDSVMGSQNSREGVISAAEPGLPAFSRGDGLRLNANTEYAWSDGGSSLVTKWIATAQPHLMGSRSVLSDVAGIKAAIQNGYPVLDGCDNYVGTGSIQGSGADACALGHYSGQGGHSTCILGYWEHPTLGPLYLYSNQWAGGTYPKDPAGAGRCCVWMTENELAKLFRTGGGGGETMALSHLAWFPAQPKVLTDWSTA